MSEEIQEPKMDGKFILSNEKPALRVVKTWNFDGLIIEVLDSPATKQQVEEIKGKVEVDDSDEGDDASTVDLDEVEATEAFNLLLENVETDVKIFNSQSDKKSEVQAEIVQNRPAAKLAEYPLKSETPNIPHIIHNELDGAAGLWGKNMHLPCFRAEETFWNRPKVQQNIFHEASTSLFERGIIQNDLFCDTTAAAEPFQLPSAAFPFREPVAPSVPDFIDLKQVFNIKEEICSMCQLPIFTDRGIILKDCCHSFCRPCLATAIETNKNAIMKCPSRIVCCDCEVRDDEIKDLLSADSYDKYIEKSLHNMDIFELEEIMFQEYVENKHPFRCAICHENIEIGDGIVLKECGDQYCKSCLGLHIQNSEEIVVNCPFIADDGFRCIGFLQDTEIRSLVNAGVYGAMLQKSIAQAEALNPNAFHCKTPDCPNWVEIEGELDEFECSACKRVNCVKCKTVHQGITCEQYIDMTNNGRNARDNILTEEQVRGLIDSRQAQPCPKCGIIVQKVDGCNHMTCLTCRHEFYWRGI